MLMIMYIVNEQRMIHFWHTSLFEKHPKLFFLKYNIVVDDNETRDVKLKCFQEYKRVSLLHSLEYSYFEHNGSHKMKVSIAAKTLHSLLAKW